MPTAERSLEQKPSEHTPGPWRAGGNHVFADTRQRCGGLNWIASTDSPYVSSTEPIANARLIAAAPDMLAALEQIRNRAKALQSDDLKELQRQQMHIEALAVAAIAKATGH